MLEPGWVLLGEQRPFGRHPGLLLLPAYKVSSPMPIKTPVHVKCCYPRPLGPLMTPSWGILRLSKSTRMGVHVCKHTQGGSLPGAHSLRIRFTAPLGGRGFSSGHPGRRCLRWSKHLTGNREIWGQAEGPQEDPTIRENERTPGGPSDPDAAHVLQQPLVSAQGVACGYHSLTSKLDGCRD